MTHTHAKHAKAAEMECGMCHNTAEAGADVRAGHKQCADCHAIDMDNPGEACLKCHVMPEAVGTPPDPVRLKEVLQKRYAGRVREAGEESPAAPAWDHSRVEGKVNCTTCHGDVVAGARKDPRDYHRNNEAPDDCAICHATNRKDVRPRSHQERQGWMLMHGGASEIGQGPGCKTCHATSFCDDCHRTEKPRNHNAMFRNRGHGFAAEGNRRSCAVCHQQDFCEACHRQSEPPSHTQAFKRQGHCRSCHEESTWRTKCQVCHTRSLGQHTPIPRIGAGRTLHALPQGYGANLHNDCTVPCHHP